MNRAKFILENCKGRILNVGCGNSVLHLLLLEKLREKLWGLDLHDYNEVYPRFEQGNAEKMPFKSGSFDTVILGDIVMHVDDINNVLSECHRVLRKEGTLIVSAPNFGSLWNRLTGTYNGKWKRVIRRIIGLKPNFDYSHAFVYKRKTTVDSVEEWMKDAKFKVDKIEITHISEDVSCIFDRGGNNMQRGWIIDARWLLCKLVPERLREQIVIKAIKKEQPK